MRTAWRTADRSSTLPVVTPALECPGRGNGAGRVLSNVNAAVVTRGLESDDLGGRRAPAFQDTVTANSTRSIGAHPDPIEETGRRGQAGSGEIVPPACQNTLPNTTT